MSIQEQELSTDAAIAEANAELAKAKAQADHSTARSRSWISIVVIAVWAIAVLGYLAWVLLRSPDFVCSLPGNSTVEGYSGTCENGWNAAIEQAKDAVTTFILPVVTLVLGFYFGKQTGSSEDTPEEEVV